jgi:RimJ/RimL family protein N-acetyltransferase
MWGFHQKPGCRSWGVTDPVGSVVGIVLFDPIYRAGGLVDGSIHICLARAAWGTDLLQQAAQQIIPQLFNEIPTLLRLSSYTPSHYKPGLAVAESLGFRQCGRMRDSCVISGVLRDMTICEMTRQDWINKEI